MHFIWLMLKGKTKTYDYLFSLNLGPQTSCVFCGLKWKIAEHLFNTCPKSQLIWNQVCQIVRKSLSFPHGFTSRLVHLESEMQLPFQK